ncbi:MAG: hypothetical protein V3V02_03955 [Rhizobiaceae bacterium]
MFKNIALPPLLTALLLFATTLPAQSENWKGEPNIGAQGVKGANAFTRIDGDYNITFSCSSKKGKNRTIYMRLNTPHDAALEVGNETSFPVYMLFKFKDGKTERQKLMVHFIRTESDITYWRSSFPLSKKFLHNFSASKTMELMTFLDKIIYLYHMNGSAKASNALIKYCYNGDYF